MNLTCSGTHGECHGQVVATTRPTLYNSDSSFTSPSPASPLVRFSHKLILASSTKIKWKRCMFPMSHRQYPSRVSFR
ncbi:hypothetical protein ElyMa_000467800, partial [Elysia marginata]